MFLNTLMVHHMPTYVSYVARPTSSHIQGSTYLIFTTTFRGRRQTRRRNKTKMKSIANIVLLWRTVVLIFFIILQFNMHPVSIYAHKMPSVVGMNGLKLLISPLTSCKLCVACNSLTRLWNTVPSNSRNLLSVDILLQHSVEIDYTMGG